MKTGLFSHPDCGLHDMGPDHPESPQRLVAINNRLKSSGLSELLVLKEAPLIDSKLLTLAHTPDYLAYLENTVSTLNLSLETNPKATAKLDLVTSLHKGSWKSICRAAGASVAAVDSVMAGEVQNAFCSTRPPGHHATRNKAMGFCFLSNVAIAAKYALETHGLERVAIVDFDVHHGNGTEDIVANDPRILMVGFYQHPFYPGTRPSSADNVCNIPVSACTGGDIIQEIMTTQWLPKLHAFKPQLILISAGFDAHYRDAIGGMMLNESDYYWLTKQIMNVADQYSDGRIVSCLEGGYDPQALSTCVETHIRALMEKSEINT